MQAHSRHCDSASRAVETMLMPVINLHPPAKYTTYPWLTWRNEKHNNEKIKNNGLVLQTFHTRNAKYRSCLVSLSVLPTHLRPEDVTTLVCTEREMEHPWLSVSTSSLKYVLGNQGAGCPRGNEIKPSMMVQRCLTVGQSTLQITFNPSLEIPHLSNCGISSSFNCKVPSNLSW